MRHEHSRRLPCPAAPLTQTVENDEAYRLEYRNAMARLRLPFTIVTTDGPGGRAGFAATGVSDWYPTTRRPCGLPEPGVVLPMRPSGQCVVCVKCAGAEHEDLSRLFGGKDAVEERFAAATWSATIHRRVAAGECADLV